MSNRNAIAFKKPTSEKQIVANRANALRSTGPRTSEGKARSARNARKHGFAATAFPVIRLEEMYDVARLRADLVEAYRPVNSQELFAVERIAIAQQALLRSARLENGMFTSCLNQTMDPTARPFLTLDAAMLSGDLDITRAQNRNFLMAEGFTRISRGSNSWNLFFRYQSQTERLYRRAIEEFDRLKKLRQELPNEPICEPQLQLTPTTSDPIETNPLDPLKADVPERLGRPQ